MPREKIPRAFRAAVKFVKSSTLQGVAKQLHFVSACSAPDGCVAAVCKAKLALVCPYARTLGAMRKLRVCSCAQAEQGPKTKRL